MRVLYASLALLSLLGGLNSQDKTFSKEFRDAKLADVVSIIGELTGVKVFVEDGVKTTPFTSSFTDSTAEQAVAVLCALNKLSWKRLSLPKSAQGVTLETVRNIVRFFDSTESSVGLYDSMTKQNSLLVKDGLPPAETTDKSDQQIIYYILDPAAKKTDKPTDWVSESIKGYQDFLRNYGKLSPEDKKRWQDSWISTMQNLDMDTIAGFMTGGFRMMLNMDPGKRMALFQKMYASLTPEEQKRAQQMGGGPPPPPGGGGNQ